MTADGPEPLPEDAAAADAVKQMARLHELQEWCADHNVSIHFTRMRSGKAKVRVEIGRMEFMGRHGIIETLNDAIDFYDREMLRHGDKHGGRKP